VDLSTNYLGLELPHPLMPGASPLVDDLSMVRRLEDAGAAAIVMHSLFEEQIAAEEHAAGHQAGHADSFGEALNYLPARPVFALGPDRYLEQLRRIREAVAVPVIASLNGVTTKGGFFDARMRIPWILFPGLTNCRGGGSTEDARGLSRCGRVVALGSSSENPGDDH
jgi:2-methylisocitrate lyase-like PEP mutase family enzyme